MSTVYRKSIDNVNTGRVYRKSIDNVNTGRVYRESIDKINTGRAYRESIDKVIDGLYNFYVDNESYIIGIKPYLQKGNDCIIGDVYFKKRKVNYKELSNILSKFKGKKAYVRINECNLSAKILANYFKFKKINKTTYYKEL